MTGLGGSILASSTGVDGDLVGLGADLLATKPFSRHQESEADAGGVRLMAEAGYNPEAAGKRVGKNEQSTWRQLIVYFVDPPDQSGAYQCNPQNVA